MVDFYILTGNYDRNRSGGPVRYFHGYGDFGGCFIADGIRVLCIR